MHKYSSLLEKKEIELLVDLPVITKPLILVLSGNVQTFMFLLMIFLRYFDIFSHKN